MTENLVALHTIAGLPLDPDFPLFRHYPAMKLGVRENVRFYAKQLAPLVEEIIAGQPSGTEWVVTAPPYFVLPSGANLIAWELCRNLSLRNVDVRSRGPNPPDSLEYSKSGVEDRIRNRQEIHEGEGAPRPDPADFRGRAVLFVNDINVTGTQQRFVERTLEPLQPASIHWLYVFQVDPELGRAHPEVEYELNHLSLASFDDFAEVLARADIDYTARCMARLFRSSHDDLRRMLASLDPTRRRRLHQLAADEGRYAVEEDRATLELLERAANELQTC